MVHLETFAALLGYTFLIHGRQTITCDDVRRVLERIQNKRAECVADTSYFVTYVKNRGRIYIAYKEKVRGYDAAALYELLAHEDAPLFSEMVYGAIHQSLAKETRFNSGHLRLPMLTNRVSDEYARRSREANGLTLFLHKAVERVLAEPV